MPRQLTFVPTLAGWQHAARKALTQGWRPEELFWEEWGLDQVSMDLVDEVEDSVPQQKNNQPVFKVPASFLPLAGLVSCHRNPQRWFLLYRVLWRLTQGERHLLEIAVDPDMNRLLSMEKAVRRDVHKMRAFVRFKAVEEDGITWYVAWFEPEHHIVERNAPFFVDRFSGMKWSILTPDRCAHWNGSQLSFTQGVAQSMAPSNDNVEDLWLRYYSSIFNPGRVKTKAMQSEMPRKYWKNLPETAVIPQLLQQAPLRTREMMARSRHKSAESGDFKKVEIPKEGGLPGLKNASIHCRACPLYKNATQTVFGEGPPTARLVFIGEQPGDQEDRQGKPFVGPAGQLLDRAFEQAGIDRQSVYITNAIKHFKWTTSGHVRLHKKASTRERETCKAWLDEEMRLIGPEIVVCLGSSAAASVLGPGIQVLRDRGKWMVSSYSAQTLVTVHPSSLLREPDEKRRAENFELFVNDLHLAAKALL